MEQKLTDEQLINNATKRAAEELGVGFSIIEDKLEFIRFYENLMCLVGNNVELARHWIYTGNKHLRFTPILRVHSSYYLNKMNQYLESCSQH